MARPIPRAPPVMMATLSFNRTTESPEPDLLADRLALGVEAMHPVHVGRHPYFAAGAAGKLAGRSRRDAAQPVAIDMQIGVGTQMLGDLNRARPLPARRR